MTLVTRWSVGAVLALIGLSCSVPSVAPVHLLVGEKDASIDSLVHEARGELDTIVDAVEHFTLPLMTLLDTSERQASGIGHARTA